MLHKLAAVVVSSLALTIPTASVVADSNSERYDRVDAYLDEFADQNGIPGVAAAVIGPEGVEHEYLRGTDGDGDPIAADTPFLLGSIAKTMTATIVMQLEREQKVELDDRVSDHIDYLSDGDPTIEQLLTHTAGFTSADGLAVADRYDNEPGAIRRAVESLEHTGNVGDYAYTSADYLVLGAIVESITGRRFADVLDARLLRPLGMNGTVAGAASAGDLPPGHRLWWGRPVGFDPEFDESGTPYASVASTLTDLARYATAQLRGDAIPAPIRRQMQTAQVESSNDHYGLGWSVTEVDGETIVHHTGATPGYFGHVYLIPDRNAAVVLLANTYSETRALAAGAGDVWRILEGEEREPAPGDVMLSAMPWLVAAIALVGLGLAALSRRWPVARPRRLVAAAACVVVGALVWLLPAFVGYDFRVLRIWMPDAAWSMVAALVALAIAAVLWLLPRKVASVNGRSRPFDG